MILKLFIQMHEVSNKFLRNYLYDIVNEQNSREQLIMVSIC